MMDVTTPKLLKTALSTLKQLRAEVRHLPRGGNDLCNDPYHRAPQPPSIFMSDFEGKPYFVVEHGFDGYGRANELYDGDATRVHG